MLQKYLFLIGSFLFSVLFHSNNVQAQQCLPQRVINQYRCVSESNTCVSWISSSTADPSCYASGSTQPNARTNCGTICGVDSNSCTTPYCSQYLQNGYTCSAQSFTANCTGAPDCRVIGNIYNCTWAGASCTEGIEPLNQQCYFTPATTPPPAAGGCTSGECFQGIANCGAVGRDNGSGSCSGGLCCVPRNTYVAGCNYNVGQTGYPSCRFSEGNGCNATCQTFGVCRDCADGLVGGGCACPGCSLSTPNPNISVSQGQSVTIPYTYQGNFGAGLRFTYSNPGIATVSQAGNTLIIQGNNLGTTAVTVSSYWSGFDPRNVCSMQLSIAVNTPPPPPECTAVSNIQTATTTCSNSQAATGTATWNWPAVAGVTSYTISVSRISDNTVVIPAQNISANALNCGAGTCSYTAGPLGGSTYRVSVRPAAGTCTVPVNLTATNGPNTAIGLCPGAIQVVSKQITTSNATCNDIVTSTTGPSPVTYGLTPQIAPATQITNGTNPIIWNNVPPQNYGLTITPSNDNSVDTVCYSTNGGATWQAGMDGTVQSGQTLLYQVGIVPARSWARVVNGDAVVCGAIRSFIPAATAQRFFSINQLNHMPGVVSYGTSYDFDTATNSLGRELVSTPRWLVQENPSTICGTNWYQYIYNKYGASGLSADYTNPLNPIAKPASRQRPYIVQGNMQTSGDWTVNDGESLVFIVNGNVQINGNIRTSGKSFIAFVANGNITISSNVGRALAENDPNIEGFYITSPSGRFITGNSTNAATARLIVFGSVISGGFTMQRDLQNYNGNNTIPGEAFRYNPMFHFSMPNEFKDMKVNWQEVMP